MTLSTFVCILQHLVAFFNMLHVCDSCVKPCRMRSHLVKCINTSKNAFTTGVNTSQNVSTLCFIMRPVIRQSHQYAQYKCILQQGYAFFNMLHVCDSCGKPCRMRSHLVECINTLKNAFTIGVNTSQNVSTLCIIVRPVIRKAHKSIINMPSINALCSMDMHSSTCCMFVTVV